MVDHWLHHYMLVDLKSNLDSKNYRGQDKAQSPGSKT